MYRDGYHSITNIDYSPVVIENMKNRSPEAQSMQWMIMDVQELRFDTGQFDVVIEKATLDALLVNEKDPWHISDDGKTLMNRVLTQVSLYSLLNFIITCRYFPVLLIHCN